ncbi:MAG: hypothetical protein OJF51_004139 [Nitrospira sp.]|nr:MAG: hypothetical protein OJF51_004139 [Nitrospira sp.]
MGFASLSKTRSGSSAADYGQQPFFRLEVLVASMDHSFYLSLC